MKRLGVGAVVLLALLLMVPDVALVSARAHRESLTWIIVNLAVPAGLLLGYFAMLGRRPWLACALMVPFAALVPVVGFYIVGYRTPITEAVLGTVAATNPREAIDFLGPWLWPLVILSLVAAALAVAAGRLSARTHLQFVTSRRVETAITALAVVTMTGIFGLQVTAKGRPPGSGSARV